MPLSRARVPRIYWPRWLLVSVLRFFSKIYCDFKKPSGDIKIKPYTKHFNAHNFNYNLIILMNFIARSQNYKAPLKYIKTIKVNSKLNTNFVIFFVISAKYLFPFWHRLAFTKRFYGAILSFSVAA